MIDLHRNKPLVWTIALWFIFVSLAVLHLRTLVPPDEGRYAEMAREMFASGDWITTRLNGIKYFEKPPLQTWMNALTYSLFGLGAWQARLWTGLCGLLGVGLTGLAGRRLFGARVGLYAALVLGSCFYWVACSQIDSLDMGLSGMTTLALCSLLIAQRDDATDRERRNWMLACWAGMALAVLAKGLIGLVLPGGVLVCYTLFARDRTIWTRLHIVKGVLLCAAIAAPWFVLVGLKNPEQPHFFFIHEHVERFLLKEHHREGAPWLFVALIAAGSIPWLGVLPHALRGGAARSAGSGAGTFQPRRLLLVWVVFITAFFSASSSKLPGYILPVFPALALLAGVALGEVRRRVLAVNAWLVAALGIALLAVAPFATHFAQNADDIPWYVIYRQWMVVAGAVALVGAAAALRCIRHRRRDAGVIALALAGFVATQLLLAGYEPFGRDRAGVNLLPPVVAELTPATRLYSVGLYEQSLTFYLKHTVTLVDYRDEFDFGLQQQPALALADQADFVQAWRRDAAAGIPAMAIVRPDILAALQRRHVALRVVAGDDRRVFIANH